jgi:hypothetical protein
MSEIKDLIPALLGYFDPAVLTGLQVAAVAILGDTVIQWVIMALTRRFDIRKMGQFIETSVLPYLGTLLVLALLTLLGDVYKAVFFGVAAIVAAKFSVEALRDKLYEAVKGLASEPVSAGESSTDAAAPADRGSA